MSRLSFTLVLVAVALAGFGCSHSADPASSTAHTRPLTRIALVARADAICHWVNIKRDRATIHVLPDYVSLYGPLAAYERRALAQLERLSPPPAMARKWRLFLASAKTVGNATAAVARDIATHRLTAANQAVKDLERAERQMIAAAPERDGFQYCSKIENDY